MISHDNINYTTTLGITQLDLRYEIERMVSYLPLSHIAGQLIDCYMPVFIGATVYFAQPDALKGTLVKTLHQAKPTFFFGVPRVWEQMQEKITAMMKCKF